VREEVLLTFFLLKPTITKLMNASSTFHKEERKEEKEELWPPSSSSSSSSRLPMTLPEYSRYGRQMILSDFGLASQLKLRNAKVLVIGAGGLGCPAIQYLAAAGIGSLNLRSHGLSLPQVKLMPNSIYFSLILTPGYISIVDHDTVEPSNLARQILHTDSKVGMPKAESIVKAMEE